MKKNLSFACFFCLFISAATAQTPFKGTEKAVISAAARKQEIPSVLKNPPEVVFVEGGAFLMGSEDGEPEEQPIHKVYVSSFYIGKYEVTVAQYREFCKETGRAMPETPKWGWQDNAPIVNVSWNDANAYCKWLVQRTGQPYRLPTEAEWEFAARGGIKTRKTRFAGSNQLEEVGWFDKNSNKRAQPVGEKSANELGLYDMSGNVWEWVQDWFDSDYYSKSPEKDPQGPPKGSMRVMRSGSWINYAEDNRIAIRISNMPNDIGPFFGFRVAMSLTK
ncbi:formylglycine-generating enzyme family protein [Rhodoflexus sp.]